MKILKFMHFEKLKECVEFQKRMKGKIEPIDIVESRHHYSIAEFMFKYYEIIPEENGKS